MNKKPKGLKRVLLSEETFDSWNLRFDDSMKYALIALMRKLPDDAMVYRWMQNFDNRGFTVIIVSSEFPEVGEVMSYDDLPIYPVVLHVNEIYAEMPFLSSNTPDPLTQTAVVNQTSCICDFPYTGLRYHKHNCPLNKSIKS